MSKFINIHTHSDHQFPGEITIRNLFPEDAAPADDLPGKFYSAGIHPWYLKEDLVTQAFEKVAGTAGKSSVIAVGETGLDKVSEVPFELQEAAFQMHLDLADRIRKPVILHCVRSWSEMLSVRKLRQTDLPWIFHGFSGKPETADQLTRKGCYISFGKALLKPNAVIGTMFRNIPLEYVFFETDDLDSPVAEVYKAAAGLKGINIETIKTQVYQNFLNCFGAAIDGKT
jgi:TatD DNase family protein